MGGQTGKNVITIKISKGLQVSCPGSDSQGEKRRLRTGVDLRHKSFPRKEECTLHTEGTTTQRCIGRNKYNIFKELQVARFGWNKDTGRIKFGFNFLGIKILLKN